MAIKILFFTYTFFFVDFLQSLIYKHISSKYLNIPRARLRGNKTQQIDKVALLFPTSTNTLKQFIGNVYNNVSQVSASGSPGGLVKAVGFLWVRLEKFIFLTSSKVRLTLLLVENHILRTTGKYNLQTNLRFGFGHSLEWSI